MVWADEVSGAGEEAERAVVRAFGMDSKKPIAGVGPLEGGSDAVVVAVAEGIFIEWESSRDCREWVVSV